MILVFGDENYPQGEVVVMLIVLYCPRVADSGLSYSGVRCDAKARGQIMRLRGASSAARKIWDFGQIRAVSLYWNEGFGDDQGACGDGELMYRVTRG